MKGLTDEERATLERWRRREYVLLEQGAFLSPPKSFAAATAVFARGLADWEVESWAERLCRAVPTQLGELALRVDAAARAAGVWP